ncbi:MAG: glycoside hydrolase family 3 N-terminal domain-containing protein [Bacteroidales bacterium]
MRILPFLFLVAVLPLCSQASYNPPFGETSHRWVDSVYQSLSPRERIGQLIMVAAYSNRGPDHPAEIERLIREYGIGGIAFFQGGPARQAALVNRFQSASRVPILMALDAEWGLAMRLDSTTRFPYQMALGAITDQELVYRMGAEIARQLRETGIQMNFAPVADVNNNPKNPVINYRSFGEDPLRVARLSRAYLTGMQDMQVLATGKHFPGHGDTDTDSHLALPQIRHSRERLDKTELEPFRQMIDQGLGSMMIAHLEVPALEPEPGLPTTLSRRVVTQLLKEQLGFKGLVVTDALNMKGVTDHFPAGEIEVRALQAGCDLLVFVGDVGLAIRSIEKAVAQGRISQEELEKSCKKILEVKYWAGLSQWKALEIKELHSRLNTPGAERINRELVAASLTVLENREEVIPLQSIDKQKIAVVSIGAGPGNPFQERLADYAPVDCFQLSRTAAEEEYGRLMNQLTLHDLVIIGVHSMDMRASMNFGLDREAIRFIDRISRQKRSIAVLFGNPYSVGLLTDPGKLAGLVVAYHENPLTMDLSAQLLFGGIGAKGRLPVSALPFYRCGDGLDTRGGIRLSFTTPEMAGLSSWILKSRIDSICQAGISAGAYPGCEVLAVRNGQVFFHECYGTHTYESDRMVSRNDLFDLASVTKVSAVTPAVMKLNDEKKLLLNARFSRYWSDFKGSDKEKMTVREVMAHVGGLPGWIPFWVKTREPDGTYKPNTLQSDSSEQFPVRVSAGLWRYAGYDSVIYRSIRDTQLLKQKKYVYSDLGFHVWPGVIERLADKDYQEFLADEFYRPLGAGTLTYNPLRKFSPDRIIPTERDTFFRMELLRGYVHDEGAAMLGGVSGNAGLFGTAVDLAKLFQMYLWEGHYGGRQYLSPQVIREFTRYQYAPAGIRRGLGFDKPLVGNRSLDWESSYPCPSASPDSYGHSGYTGTFVWADPSTGLLFIFLSNRVYPTRDNNRLTSLFIRKTILQTLYDAIQD